MENKNNTIKKKKGIKFYIPLIIVTILVAGGLGYWYREYTKYLSTDDAHVDSDNVAISSKILGRIVRLYADEGDSIKEGALMAELDSTDLLAQKNQFIALREQSVASQTQTIAKYQYDKESINVQKIALEKAQDDYTRARKQYTGGVITREQFDHIQKSYETAKVQLSTAQKQLAVSKAAIESARTAVKSAQKQIGITISQLKNTKLYAPSNGVVAKRWLLPGDVTQPGQSILTVSNNRKVWISVFLEETKIGAVHLNQRVRFTVDAYPGVIFTGHVYSVGANTAAQFSLIPANNASGNFTKVTQRIQIKVSIDGPEDHSDKRSYRFLPGMSSVVKIVKD